MNKNITVVIKIVLCILAISVGRLFAQDKPVEQKQSGLLEISGQINDSNSNEPLIGATVSIKGTLAATATDTKGFFKLRTSQRPPFKLMVSGIGYQTQEYNITDNSKSLIITLNQQSLITDEVVISASRIEESQLKSPVAIEKLDIRAIKESPSGSFYDALENVKGVQMITSSLTFKIPNTRGFNVPNNFRFMQLVDGVDMQAATLGVPLGNAIGPTELDIESVEITPGASSALYGMNAINGMSNLITKSPFLYQGLGVYLKAGVNHVDDKKQSGFGPQLLREGAIRYAKAFNNRFAFKVNGSYLEGTDWVANTTIDNNPNSKSSNINPPNPLFSELSGANNPAYDAWNAYGNENNNNVSVSVNYKGQDRAFNVRRTGYNEKDLVQYNVRNIKADAALHYKLSEKLELSYGYRIGRMDGIFQRGNRIQLKDVLVQNYHFDLKGSNFVWRSYISTENTGKSYNMKPLADNLDLNNGSNAVWGSRYQTELQNQLNAGTDLAAAHQFARNIADIGRVDPNVDKAAFDKLKNTITSINNWDIAANVPGAPVTGGAALLQNSRLYHSELQYDFSPYTGKYIDLLTGIDYRTYEVLPDGNDFVDFSKPLDKRNETGGKSVYYSKYGGFVQATKKLFKDKLKVVGSLRVDHNTSFDPVVNPRFAAVYTIAQKHNIRFTVQNGYRYPALFEALSYVNNGQVRRVGGLEGINNGLGFNENSYTLSSVNIFNSAVSDSVAKGYNRANAALLDRNIQILQKTNLPSIKPEQILAFELGYKSILFNNRVVIDYDAFINQYTGFLGQVEVAVPTSGKVGTDEAVLDMVSQARQNQNRYRVFTNAKNTYTNLGSGLSLNYNFYGKFTVGGNLNYNTLLSDAQKADLFITAFNTPKWAGNISFGNREIVKNLGFNIVCKWQQEFSWESPLVNGPVPAFWTMDAQVNYRIPKAFATIKLGGTNILNKQYYQYAAGPSIGALYYVSLTFDGPLNKTKKN